MSSESQSFVTQIMTPASLPSLPVELLCRISNHLSYGSPLALSFTCRELYAKVDAPRQPYTLPSPSGAGAKAKVYKMADLLEIEKWPEHSPSQSNRQRQSKHTGPEDLFACNVCLRLRPGTKFLYPDRDSHSWIDARGGYGGIH